MNKDQFLASLRDVYCRLGVTDTEIGVIAVRPIPKGTDPFKNCDPFGDRIELPEAELNAYSCDEKVKNIVRDFCVLQNGVYYVPDYGIDAIDKSFYLNHSKSPNLVAADGGEFFIAARDIALGEELTADYDTFNDPSEVLRFQR